MTRILFFNLICASIFFVAISNANAIDDFIVEIEQVSSSGKTIVVNNGHISTLKENEFGILLKKEINSDKKIIFKPVARLRAIKVYTGQSVWITYKSFLPKEIKKGRGLYLFTENEVLRGRAALSVKRLKLVTHDDTSKELADFLVEGDNLRKKNDYEVLAKAHAKKITLDKDVELIDLDKWQKANTGNSKKRVSIYRSPYAKQFSEHKRVDTFEKMMVAFLNKYNNPSFDYDEFYKDQKRGRYNNIFQEKSLSQTYNALYERRVLDKVAKEEKFKENIRAKGDGWSDDYSDEELSELLNGINVVSERQRRRKLVAFKYNSQAYISAGFNLINNESGEDSQTSGSSRSDFELAWEIFLLKKYNDLKKFTLETSLRQANDSFDGGSLNVRSSEQSMAIHVNWYPYHGPEVLKRNIVYVGVLTRFGYSRLTNDTTGEEGNYQVASLPGIRAGLKYNFKSSFGIRLTTGLENIKVSRITKSADEGALPNSASYLEGKFGIGLSKFF